MHGGRWASGPCLWRFVTRDSGQHDDLPKLDMAGFCGPPLHPPRLHIHPPHVGWERMPYVVGSQGRPVVDEGGGMGCALAGSADGKRRRVCLFFLSFFLCARCARAFVCVCVCVRVDVVCACVVLRACRHVGQVGLLTNRALGQALPQARRMIQIWGPQGGPQGGPLEPTNHGRSRQAAQLAQIACVART